ncbi:MAG: XRE family transcriptional regulator [Actinophytocola sp.]|uniref:helix-turn-helix transcriptional regulator n=1 Tax=Actinophytocola sp. TaxID=1872138 RepID=UPI00132BC37F|nr:helix-turn-helix transcriptional regulator [Actinophytocola sp.]MPZ81462.1 XRE family transcriptional regulator [Actinophytocola sp.]
MNDLEPTIRSRELGLALSRQMDVLDMSQLALARELEWSPSMVSRMISGKRPVSAELMSGVLGVLRITGPKRRELMEMARRATERGWWQEFGNRLPPELTTLSAQEDSAIAITSFETTVIPGLLQTTDYMTALMKATPSIPAAEIPDQLKVRRLRQEVFDLRHSPQFRFFIDEYAICRTGAGGDVMSGQVHHLLSMSVRPNVEIRVVPEAVGFHAGRKPFQLMEFTEVNPVLFIENDTSVLFLEREDTIAGYRDVAAELSRIALDEGHSRSWLATVASELGAPREDHDAKRPAGIFELEED